MDLRQSPLFIVFHSLFLSVISFSTDIAVKACYHFAMKSPRSSLAPSRPPCTLCQFTRKPCRMNRCTIWLCKSCRINTYREWALKVLWNQQLQKNWGEGSLMVNLRCPALTRAESRILSFALRACAPPGPLPPIPYLFTLSLCQTPPSATPGLWRAGDSHEAS
jgi:hypothetical protein